MTGEETPLAAIGVIAFLLRNVKDGITKYAPHLASVDAYLDDLGQLEAWIGQLNLKELVKTNGAPDRRLYVHNLNSCSDVFSTWSWKFTTLGVESLEGLRATSQQLLEEALLAKDVDAVLREFIVDTVHAILRAIDHYDLWGSQGLREVIERSMGRFGATRPASKAATKKSVPKVLAGLIGLMAEVTVLTGEVAQSAENTLRIERAMEQMIEDVGPRALPPGTPALEAGPSLPSEPGDDSSAP